MIINKFVKVPVQPSMHIPVGFGTTKAETAVSPTLA